MRSLGLCLPHLHLALAAAPPEIAEFLLEQGVLRWKRFRRTCTAFVLKRDALRRGLINDQEETSWWRALVQLSGSGRLSMTEAQGGELSS